MYKCTQSFSAALLYYQGEGEIFGVLNRQLYILLSGPLTWFKVEHTFRLAYYADSFRVRVYNQASAGVQKS